MQGTCRNDGKVNMCQALTEMLEDERTDGKNEGMRIQAEKDAAIMAEKDMKIEELLRIVNGKGK